MPCAYHIDADAGLITVSGTEDVALPEALALGRKLVRDEDFHSELPHLIDLRGLSLTRNSDQSRAFRDFVLLEFQPCIGAQVAVLVDESLDPKSLAALYHLIGRVDLMELFDNYDLALRWLMRQAFAPETATAEAAGAKATAGSYSNPPQ